MGKFVTLALLPSQVIKENVKRKCEWLWGMKEGIYKENILDIKLNK